MLVYTVISLAVMMGLAALVVDAGAWYRAHRQLQAVVDAASLAGAQKLPQGQAAAESTAAQYAALNNGPEPIVTFPAAGTIDVRAVEQSPGVFSRIYGAAFDEVEVSAHARARIGAPGKVQGVVPIVVAKNQPQLVGCGGPCFGSGYPATLAVNDDATLGGGQMGLIDLRSGGDGSVTAGQIADWVWNGLNDLMDPNRYYYAAGSCKFSNQNFHDALDAKVASATPLVFPVYDPSLTDVTTTPPRYWIVGWAGFVVTSYRLNGCGNKNDYVKGYFVQQIANGVSSDTMDAPSYGIYIVNLVE